MKRELIVEQDPKSPISEVFRTLRTNMQFMNSQGKLKTILVTSTFVGEGKSWVSSNLAVTFAQTNKKVILLDADMRKGRQYSIFDVSPKPGLSNYLSGISESGDENTELNLDDYIQKTDINNLYLMAAGNVPPNPAELLTTPQMVDLLNKLKDLYDIVIIDGTPSQLVTDALILTRLVDSTIIVTACNETKKEDLKKSIANIQQVGGKVSGIVLNKVQVNAKRYEQSYYYGSTRKMNSKRKPLQKRPQKSSRSRSKKASNDFYNRSVNLMNQNINDKPNIDVNTENNINNNKTDFEKNNINNNKIDFERKDINNNKIDFEKNDKNNNNNSNFEKDIKSDTNIVQNNVETHDNSINDKNDIFKNYNDKNNYKNNDFKNLNNKNNYKNYNYKGSHKNHFNNKDNNHNNYSNSNNNNYKNNSNNDFKNEKSNELHNKIKIENPEPAPMEKTTEILDQINEYLEKEKKKLK